MEIRFQLATEKDVSQLIEMMRELYRHDALSVFNEEAAKSGLNKTLLDPTLGSVYLILVAEEPAGYLVLTYCFSLEFHGKFMLLDEIYLREGFRQRGIGKAAVELAESICRKTGIKYLRLEVTKRNRAAQALYDSTGFKREARYLYSKQV
jgi:ribosomal protein S18 acetylase RimI-like enzyme